MTPLRQRMIEDMELEKKPHSTQRAYIRNVGALAKFYETSPDQLSREQIRDYLVYLVQEKKCAGSTYRQALSSIRYFYRTTLGKDWLVPGIQHTRVEKKLPVVMSVEEVDRFFAALHSLKYRAVLMTAYAGGLRVSEVVKLRVADIDSDRMMIRIELRWRCAAPSPASKPLPGGPAMSALSPIDRKVLTTLVSLKLKRSESPTWRELSAAT